MRHTLIRRFTAETQKLRRKDTDGDDPDERFVPVDETINSSRMPLTDASQHTQENRATPRQENLGILEPMRLAQQLYFTRSIWGGPSVLPEDPGQQSSRFPSLDETFHEGSSQPFSTSSRLDDLPHSTAVRHHPTTNQPHPVTLPTTYPLSSLTLDPFCTGSTVQDIDLGGEGRAVLAFIFHPRRPSGFLID